MGCKEYVVGGHIVRWSENSDEFACLCTFPHNDGEELTPERVRGLALLGAATALARRDRRSITIPDDLPAWVVEGVQRLVPDGVDG